MNEPHRHRQVAESFGSAAEQYDRARPSYPRFLVDRIVAASPGLDVLDVGCGTGIAARQFQAAGCRVLGLDPDARMARLAQQNGIEVEVTTFESWDPAVRKFDAVISAQAWHWVDPVAGAAKAAEALRADGRLAVFWNAMQPSPEVAAAFAGVYRQVQPDLPFKPWETSVIAAYLTMCGKAADGMREAGAFGEPQRWRFDWNRTYTRSEWLEVVPTFGGHSQLRSATLDELLAGIGAVLDTMGGGFTMHYATVAVTAARTAPPAPA